MWPEHVYRKHRALVPLIFSDQRKNLWITAFQSQKKHFVSLLFNIKCSKIQWLPF